MSRVIVIGGGAAGLMAAGSAAMAGADVLLIEKTKKLGNKLRLTGNRHGNLAHVGSVAEQLDHYVGEPRFAQNALYRFDTNALVDFFLQWGVPTETEPDGRMFPRSRNAHDIVSALRRYCLDGGVVFRYSSPVQDILVSQGDLARVRGVLLADRELEGDAVIVCTGGRSYPKTGSTGDGYRWAERLGHNIAPLHPGLVALYSEEPLLEAAAGVALKDVHGSIWRSEGAICDCRGDLLMTHQGVSGPLAFSLSSRLGLSGDDSLTLVLDLAPSVTLDQLDRNLQDHLRTMGRAQYRHLVRRLVPSRLVPLFCAKAAILPQHRLSQFSAAQRSRTCETLKALPISLAGTAPFEQAMVTVGGVLCSEIDPRTMASRVVEGLYWAGEVLDVTGADSGGYNLQLAFATGHGAGLAAAAWVGEHV